MSVAKDQYTFQVKLAAPGGTYEFEPILKWEPAGDIIVSNEAALNIPGKINVFHGNFTGEPDCYTPPTSFAGIAKPTTLSCFRGPGAVEVVEKTSTFVKFKVTLVKVGGEESNKALCGMQVEESAAPPVLTCPGPQTNHVGEAVSLKVEATETTEYKAEGLPVGLSINGSTGVITGTPTTFEIAKVKLIVEGPGGSAECEFEWTIISEPYDFFWHIIERPPTVVNPGTQHNRVTDHANLGIEATRTTEYKATSLPKGLSINSGTGVITGECTTVGENIVKVTVKGPGGEASVEFLWVVEKPPCVYPTDPGAPWKEFKETPIKAQPGDAIISAASGNVYKNVEGKLAPLGTGEKGETGPKGEKGEAGPKGETGPKGEKGSPGSEGKEGPKGEKGEAGIEGKEGKTGPEGKEGAKGEKGTTGEKGATGAEGAPKTAKAPLKVVGSEIELEEGQLTNAYIKPKAEIEDSKLALTTVVKLTGNQEIAGEKTFAQTINAKGNIHIEGEFILAPTALTELSEKENNNYNFGAHSAVFFKPANAETFITGFAGVSANAVFIVSNQSTTQTLLLAHSNAKSENFNKFFFQSQKPVLLQPLEKCYIIYDFNRERYILFAGQGNSPWATSESTTEAYPFMAPIELGAKVENGATVKAAVRSENNGARIALRGQVKIKALETLTAGEMLMTLPAQQRPAVESSFDSAIAGVFAKLTITTAGVVTLSANALAGETINLDGISFGRN